ncbi:Allatotropin [Orchesella cincta]|uniref:Allatotropin n=1 Tax=Orchesella cincta TaxID=48709 RepID=A0A1D2NC73_ORCCI|nr:Allatotropin [Orchesella cincta]
MSRFYLHFAILGLIVGMTVATGSSVNTGRSGYPRSNRGFRNSQLSTARGFGKRDSGSLVSNSRSSQGLSLANYEGFLPVVFDSSRTNYPTSWLVELLQNNPDVAKFIVDRLVDENGDGELTPSELTRRACYY